MTQPLISIVLINFNGEHYIERALCSVLDQDYTDLELIVVDGGSTDNSLNIIERYTGELDMVLTGPDAGPSDAINRGLTHATGYIVGVLHSNDLLLPGALQTAAKEMTGDDAASWLVGSAERIDAFDGERCRASACAPDSLASYLQRDSGLIPHGASFWHRDLVGRIGVFDCDLMYAGHYEYACRLLASDIEPRVLAQPLAANRERTKPLEPNTVLRRDVELLEVAAMYAPKLTVAERYNLWRNLDQRRRIHAMAHAETAADTARSELLSELLAHPWWLADESFRRRLLRGIEHPVDSRRVA